MILSYTCVWSIQILLTIYIIIYHY